MTFLYAGRKHEKNQGWCRFFAFYFVVKLMKGQKTNVDF